MFRFFDRFFLCFVFAINLSVVIFEMKSNRSVPTDLSISASEMANEIQSLECACRSNLQLYSRCEFLRCRIYFNFCLSQLSTSSIIIYIIFKHSKTYFKKKFCTHSTFNVAEIERMNVVRTRNLKQLFPFRFTEQKVQKLKILVRTNAYLRDIHAF